jgi:hypothetical protein
MKMQWEDLPNGVRKRLVTDLEDSNGRGLHYDAVSSLLMGCELLGYPWHLYQGARHVVLSAFANVFRYENDSDEFVKQFMLCMHNFTSNEMKWESFPEHVQQAVFRFLQHNSSRFSSQDMTEILLQ